VVCTDLNEDAESKAKEKEESLESTVRFDVHWPDIKPVGAVCSVPRLVIVGFAVGWLLTVSEIELRKRLLAIRRGGNLEVKSLLPY
jgi:hypothetical protein